MVKANRTAELWRERVLAQQASGQSVRGWCRANNCPEHGFYWWRARLGLSPASARERRRLPKAASIGFARVAVEPSATSATTFAAASAAAVSGPTSAAERIRLSLAGGRELLLPASMPVEQIARLVRAIESADVNHDRGAA